MSHLRTLLSRWFLPGLLVVMLLGPALALGKPTSLGIGQDAVYAIRWDDQLIGYSRYTVERSVSLGGQQIVVINSDARLKVGAQDDIAFKAKLMLDEKGVAPTFFFCRQTQGKQVLEIDCLFTDKSVAQKTRVGNDESASTVDVGRAPLLVFNNVWGRLDTFVEHYALMLSRWLQTGARTGVPVYDPVLRGATTLTFQAHGKGTVRIDSRNVTARRFALVDGRGTLVLNAWVSEDSNRVLKIEEPGGFSFTLTSTPVATLLKGASAANLERDRTQFSSVYFPNARSLRGFRAQVEARLRGNAVPERQVLGFSQKFTGDATAGRVKGLVDVTTSSFDVKKSEAWPRRKKLEGDLAIWLQPAPGIESAADELKSKGAEVAWRSRTTWEAARKISAWVHDKVKTGYSLPSARYALEQMTGNAESKAMLAVGLMRAVGIPARKIDGFVFSDGDFVPHHWVEVYVGEEGWAPLDPTTGEEGLLGATHVALGEGGSELVGMKVDVQGFAPLPPARVPFFNKELAWPVGQERTYSVTHGGKEIGREVAAVTGLTRHQDKDAFVMEFSSDVQVADGPLSSKARLVTDPQVLPLTYEVSSTAGAASKKSRAYVFGDGKVTEDVKFEGKDLSQVTPISNGLYVADRRFMSMWGLLVGQLPRPEVGQRYTMHVYMPDSHTTEEVSLTVRQEEKVGVAGEERDAWRVETTDGISFFVDKETGQVVRIEHPRQDLVLQLVESKTRI